MVYMTIMVKLSYGELKGFKVNNNLKNKINNISGTSKNCVTIKK